MKNNMLKFSSGHSLKTEKNITRRTILKTGGILTVFALSGNIKGFGESKDESVFSFAVVTDMHYADKENGGTRHYRDSLQKLTDAITMFNKNKPRFLIELGDFIDAADKETEMGYLRTVNKLFRSFDGPCYYVMGNHDVATFTKDEFVAKTGMTAPYYSFDIDSYHFVVLDANFMGDGTSYNAGNFEWTDTIIPGNEQEWLKRDLETAHDRQTVVFIHQNLHDESNPHGVKNAPAVRTILENAGNVRLVIQGHDHSGAYAEISGIHYLTLKAMVEGPYPDKNSYVTVYLHNDGSISVEGFGEQTSKTISR